MPRHRPRPERWRGGISRKPGGEVEPRDPLSRARSAEGSPARLASEKQRVQAWECGPRLTIFPSSISSHSRRALTRWQRWRLGKPAKLCREAGPPHHSDSGREGGRQSEYWDIPNPSSTRGRRCGTTTTSCAFGPSRPFLIDLMSTSGTEEVTDCLTYVRPDGLPLALTHPLRDAEEELDELWEGHERLDGLLLALAIHPQNITPRKVPLGNLPKEQQGGSPRWAWVRH